MIEVINYTPYRGYIKVLDVRKSEVKLYDRHLELTYNYDIEDTLGQREVRIAAYTIPKDQISIELTMWSHEDDKDNINYPRVEIFVCGNYQDFIYVETMDEAAKIYNKLKNWLIG